MSPDGPYLSPSVDAAGLAQAKVYAGSASVITNALGAGQFTASFPAELTGRQFVTALASPDTDSDASNSSELFHPVPVADGWRGV